MNTTTGHSIVVAARILSKGGIVAYPTETVFGLGCDPANVDAIQRLLTLKHRDPTKGLILIATTLAQLECWILPLDQEICTRVMTVWPGPVTWVVPARPEVSTLLRGSHAGIAVRITAHTTASALAHSFGNALVSTSANPAGHSPARKMTGVQRYFGDAVDYYLDGASGNLARPTEIRDALTGKQLRF